MLKQYFNQLISQQLCPKHEFVTEHSESKIKIEYPLKVLSTKSLKVCSLCGKRIKTTETSEL